MECVGASAGPGAGTGSGEEMVGLVDTGPDNTGAETGYARADPVDIQPWDIDPNHGMHVGPGFLGDAPHSLRTREVFR